MGTIVFCEDDPTIQKLIRVAFRAHGHTVRVVGDGQMGLEVIEQEPPDLVISDVSMPRLDGFQLAERLQATPRLAQIPVVFMTASAQRSEIEACRQRGAVDFIAKPFSPAELRHKVDRLLASRAAGGVHRREAPSP
jgi:CheY-like chemotaxis protein